MWKSGLLALTFLHSRIPINVAFAHTPRRCRDSHLQVHCGFFLPLGPGLGPSGANCCRSSSANWRAFANSMRTAGSAIPVKRAAECPILVVNQDVRPFLKLRNQLHVQQYSQICQAGKGLPSECDRLLQRFEEQEFDEWKTLFLLQCQSVTMQGETAQGKCACLSWFGEYLQCQ